MSDHYLALIDPLADATNADVRAERLLKCLISESIVLAETSGECVLGGVGYLPGPRLNDADDFGDHEVRYWDMLNVCGVEIHAGRWVNVFGFTVFEWARCPACNQAFDDGGEIMDPLVHAVGDFLEKDQPALLRCPACHGIREIQSWITKPHLGLCYVAAQFWNWPDFSSKRWRISIPDIASKAIRCSLISTYGRV